MKRARGQKKQGGSLLAFSFSTGTIKACLIFLAPAPNEAQRFQPVG